MTHAYVLDINVFWPSLDRLADALRHRAGRPPHPPEMGVGPVSPKPPAPDRGPDMAISVTLNDQQQVRLHIAPTKHGGGAARLDGVPTWEFANLADLPGPPGALAPAPDGLSCDFIPNDVADAAVQFDVIATADVDPGTGVVPVTATFHVEVDPSLADNLNPTADPPTDKAPAVPQP